MGRTLSFILFISVVITIYSLLNYYFIKKHRNIITLKSLPGMVAWFLVAIIITTPILTIIFSYTGPSFLHVITSFTGYSWLAFLFLFLITHGIADIVLLIAEKLGYSPHKKTARYLFIITLVINISILFYGRYEAHSLVVEHVTFKTDKLPENIEEFKILQISDVHFSPLTSVEKAHKIDQIVSKQKPDLVISTGDLLDRGIRNEGGIIDVLKRIEAPFGKYAVSGNHEFISGINDSIAFTERSGFTMIRNRIVNVADIIQLAGVDDISASRFVETEPVADIDVLRNRNPALYTVFLKHQPRVDEGSTKYFDLMLSGHTHAGQIFPFTLFVRLVFPYLCGKYELENGAFLYVSRGTGTWGPPFRFLAPPEVTVITITRQH